MILVNRGANILIFSKKAASKYYKPPWPVESKTSLP